jgi:polyferredoxin
VSEQKKKKRSGFRHGIVTARYWVNGFVIAALIGLPSFHVIKFDFTNGEFFLFGDRVHWLTTATGFLGFWAGSYVLTILADYVYGRLFCGWICSWGTILRTLSYTADKAKRKKIPVWAPTAMLVGASLLSTFGLMNWFVDMSVLIRPSHAAFVPLMITFVTLNVTAAVMLRKVALKFCQSYCPIGWYLGVISQKHAMRIDFEVANCTLGDVCVRECPMALDPRLLSVATEKDHTQCILCGDCLTSCNKCAAKVEGEKPLLWHMSRYEQPTVDLAGELEAKREAKKRRTKPQAATVIAPKIVLKEKELVEV